MAWVRAWWPAGRAGYALAVLIFLGLALRILAMLGSWPTLPTLDDGYQVFAGSNPFMDPQHPAGYALIIAALGAVTRRVAVLILLQHVLGIASAALLFAATRRITGSAWAGLLPAAMVLLGGDQIFLEHVAMSESWEVLAGSAGLYAAARTMDDPLPWWRWPLLTGVVMAAAVMIRTAALPLVAVAAGAMIIHRSAAWRAPLAVVGTAIIVLFVFAGANARFGPGFGLAPSPGWYLYGDVAQFADCKQFTPPPQTAALCQTLPPNERGGPHYYLYEPQAPAPQHFGRIGTDDGLVGAWARRALLAQPGDFLSTAWTYLRTYFVPGSAPPRFHAAGAGLEPGLDFTFTNPFFAPAIKHDLESYFDPFTVRQRRGALRFLHGWQQVFGFGATALLITTLLTLIGLLIGTRRSRAGVFLFGIGGLALLAAPVLDGNYIGRYTVPMAGPLMAAAAIALLEVWRVVARRRVGQVVADGS